MAVQFFDCKGFGQIEPNQVWFTRAGMIEAQCELNEKEFAAHFPMTKDEATSNKIYAEDGMFLMVDKTAKTLHIPNETMSKRGFPMGINYSTEKIYNQFTPGRRNFCMIAGEFLPRIGYVEPGMRITTNCVAWDAADSKDGHTSSVVDSDKMYDAVKQLLATNEKPLYAFVTKGSQGRLQIGADVSKALGNVYAQVVKAYTNADGTKSFMFQFINKPDEAGK